MRWAIHLADWEPVELEAPYLNLDKGDIAIKGRALGVDYSLTWSCYKGAGGPAANAAPAGKGWRHLKRRK